MSPPLAKTPPQPHWLTNVQHPALLIQCTSWTYASTAYTDQLESRFLALTHNTALGPSPSPPTDSRRPICLILLSDAVDPAQATFALIKPGIAQFTT